MISQRFGRGIRHVSTYLSHHAKAQFVLGAASQLPRPPTANPLPNIGREREREASEMQPVAKAVGQASVEDSRLVRSESYLHACSRRRLLKRTRVHACLARGTFSTIPLSRVSEVRLTQATLLAALPTSLVRLLVHSPCAGQPRLAQGSAKVCFGLCATRLLALRCCARFGADCCCTCPCLSERWVKVGALCGADTVIL